MPTTIGTLAALLGCVIDTTAAFAPGAAAPPLLHAVRPARTPASPLLSEEGGGPFAALSGLGEKVGGLGKQAGEMGGKVMGMFGGSDSTDADKAEESDDDKMTLDKVASFGIAGILSIAVAETVFWVLSFPTSELLYFVSTGEWIDLTNQEGQLKFLAFTAGWGALGGVIAQYRTVLTAAAMTPWMDTYAHTESPRTHALSFSHSLSDACFSSARAASNVVKPYVNPALERFEWLPFGKGDANAEEPPASELVPEPMKDQA